MQLASLQPDQRFVDISPSATSAPVPDNSTLTIMHHVLFMANVFCVFMCWLLMVVFQVTLRVSLCLIILVLHR